MTARAAKRRKGSRRRPWAWVLGGVAGGVIAVGIWIVLGSNPGRRMPDEGQGHVPAGIPVRYRHHPPTSGLHWPKPAPWGDYEQEVPEETWVHNLEHGGIVILYRCETPCPDLVRQLREVYASFPKSKYGHVKILISPYSKLKTRLAALAWSWIDELDSFDRNRLLHFYRAHVDRGPEDVP